MSMMHVAFILALDMMPLFLLCHMILDQEKVSINEWLKWIFCIGIFYLISRIGFLSMDQTIIVSLLAINYDILPVNSLSGTLLLSLVLMIGNSKFLKMSNQKSLFGTLFLISALIFIRVFAIIVCSLIMMGDNLYSLAFRSVAFMMTVIIVLLRPYDRLKHLALENSLIMKYSVVVTFICAIVLVMTVQFDVRIMLLHSVKVVGSLGLIVLFNSVVIWVQSKQLQRKKRIMISEQYLPMIEELIIDVRARQHEFDNKLTAIFSILEDATEIEEAKRKIAAYTKNVLLDNTTREILRCENRIIAGVIYSKVQSAKDKKIEIVVDNQATFCNIVTPEYEIVEVIGILIDNAIEASKAQDIIYIEMKREQQHFQFVIYNPSPSIAPIQFMNMFEKGYSTKQSSHEKRRGYGLYNVKKIMEQYNGKILTKNVEKNDKNYIMIGIELP